MASEKFGEEGGVGKIQPFGDFGHRGVGRAQQALGLLCNELLDPVIDRATRRAMDNFREVFGGNAEPIGIECKRTLRYVVAV